MIFYFITSSITIAIIKILPKYITTSIYYIIPNTLHVPITTAYAIPLKHITLKLNIIIFKLTLTNFITYWFYFIYINFLIITKYTNPTSLLQIISQLPLISIYVGGLYGVNSRLLLINFH